MLYMDRVSFILANANGKLLDVGFNACSLHDKIREKFSSEQIFGIDIVIDKKYKGNYVKASAERMPFKDSVFDCVIAGELVEHLKKPELFVKEAERILKDAGKLIITTPNRKSLINRLFHSYEAPLHFTLFSREELFKLLEKNNFKVVKFTCFPYTEESSSGSRHKQFFFLRKLLHRFLPQCLQENMCVVAVKQ
ncbi:MAG: class I SAM-dependent methyltransferase [Candidatus Diapherotrites archaeon]|nr:class I SAM-dependent methyltransferase [Candidatus Diapherotrites archaeon]